MKYKKITFACVLLGLSLYAGVCAATVREVADEAPASKQTIIADKKDKKLLNKKQRAVQITQEKCRCFYKACLWHRPTAE